MDYMLFANGINNSFLKKITIISSLNRENVITIENKNFERKLLNSYGTPVAQFLTKYVVLVYFYSKPMWIIF